MKASTTPGLIALSMENPALEFDNFDRVVAQYRTRVLRFLLASVGDMDVAGVLDSRLLLERLQCGRPQERYRKNSAPSSFCDL